MLFESYKDYEYDRQKLEIEQEYYTPSTTFINAFQTNLTFRDVLPYIKDEDRKIKQSVLKLIVSYCKGMARTWKIDDKYYENYSEKFDKPDQEFTHTLYLFQYLDEWSLAIYVKELNKICSYALSESVKQKMKKLFSEKQQQLDIEYMLQLQQTVTIAEADTTVMIKLLYKIFQQKDLKIELNPNTLIEWRKQTRIVDLFLFHLHRKQLEQQNKSQASQQHRQQNSQQISAESSFSPDKLIIGEANNFTQNSKKSKTPNNLSFEKELSRSKHGHRQISDEMIELTQEEFQYMMDKFKDSVVQELQQIEPQDPSLFLQKYLKGNGELRVRKDEKGKNELIVNIKGDRLQTLLQQYEKYYEQTINEQQYLEQQEKAKVQYQQYMQFQQLLNYYYQTDPEKYTQLVQEYYRRLNEQTLKKLDPLLQQQQPQKVIDQYQQNKRQSNISQSYPLNKINQSQQSLQSPILKNLNLSDRYNNQSNAQISFNVSKNNSLSNQSLSLLNPKLDKQVSPSPFNSIVASRYNKSVTQAEVNLMQGKGNMSENLLNFYIRYLEEKQAHQPEETLRQFRIRTFFLSTTFYRALQNGYNNPDNIQYEQAKVYTQKYIGKDNTIFDKFDQILIPIVVAKGLETILVNINLAQESIIFYDTILNGLGAKSMASSQIAQNGLLNNPFLLSCLRFLEMEYNQKLMKPLSLLKWQIQYSPHEKLSDNNQTNTLTALLMTSISSGKTNKQSFSGQLEIAQFIQKLQSLFSKIGVTQNRKNELHFEQMPL